MAYEYSNCKKPGIKGNIILKHNMDIKNNALHKNIHNYDSILERVLERQNQSGRKKLRTDFLRRDMGEDLLRRDVVTDLVVILGWQVGYIGPYKVDTHLSELI